MSLTRIPSVTRPAATAPAGAVHAATQLGFNTVINRLSHFSPANTTTSTVQALETGGFKVTDTAETRKVFGQHIHAAMRHFKQKGHGSILSALAKIDGYSATETEQKREALRQHSADAALSAFEVFSADGMGTLYTHSDSKVQVFNLPTPRSGVYSDTFCWFISTVDLDNEEDYEQCRALLEQPAVERPFVAQKLVTNDEASFSRRSEGFRRQIYVEGIRCKGGMNRFENRLTAALYPKSYRDHVGDPRLPSLFAMAHLCAVEPY